MTKKMKFMGKPAEARDLREGGRIILAHGEVTGHCHEVSACADDIEAAIPPAQFFEEPGTGRRILLALRKCELKHDEHGTVTIDPARPTQLRQGDVFLNPIGNGAYDVVRQREYSPAAIRSVAD